MVRCRARYRTAGLLIELVLDAVGFELFAAVEAGVLDVAAGFGIVSFFVVVDFVSAEKHLGGLEGDRSAEKIDMPLDSFGEGSNEEVVGTWGVDAGVADLRRGR